MAFNGKTPIGERVKSIRELKGLSLDAAAEKAGCSVEYLEWVEKGQVEPSVALLLRLAKAMNLGPSSFLGEGEAPEARLEEDAKRTRHYSYTKLSPPEESNHLMAFSIVIPPKTAHEGVGYRHEGEEFVYVLGGALDLTVGDELRQLGQGESTQFDSGQDHHMSNPGDEETTLLVILYIP